MLTTNPYHPDDHWKNKARLESISEIQRRQAEIQKQKVQQAVEYLIKKLIHK